ncbi:MAG: phosphoribosylglycinamide formyltransferase [Myxococcota bacterium]
MTARDSQTHLKIGVLLSGEGTSLENLAECIDGGGVPAEIVVVVASKSGSGGLERARRRGIPAVAVPRTQHPDVGTFNDALHAVLEEHGADFVALLGFLSPFETRGRFDARTINVHPALIPAFCGKGFYGGRVHEAVLEAGVKVTGATVHFVDAQYDHGPIILQEAVPVRDDDTPDTLAERVRAAERRLVPEAIRLFAAGCLRIDDGRVRIKP